MGYRPIPEDNMRRVLTLFIVGLFATVGAAQTQLQGLWTATPSDGNPGKIHFQFDYGKHDNSGTDIDLQALAGLTQAAVDGPRAPVKFELKREEGAVSFSGEFGDKKGYGDFKFTASSDYIAAMKNAGYDGVEKNAFMLCVLDVSRAYDAELRSLGYHPTLNNLIEGRIFRVGREQVESLKSVGITNLPFNKLVEFRIFDVNPEYIRQTRTAYPGIGNERLVELKIHKVTPEFAKQMAAEGYPNLTLDQLVAFRIHNVTPEFIHQMRQLGFKALSADRLVEFRIFNVNKDQIDELAKAGYTGLTPQQLVAFRIHGVNNAFIEKVKSAGYSHPTPDQLVEFKILGIRVAKNDI